MTAVLSMQAVVSNHMHLLHKLMPRTAVTLNTHSFGSARSTHAEKDTNERLLVD